MVGICLHPTCSVCSRRFPVCPEPRAIIALTKVSAFSILHQVFLSNVTHTKEQSLVWLWSPPWASGVTCGDCVHASAPLPSLEDTPGAHRRWGRASKPLVGWLTHPVSLVTSAGVDTLCDTPRTWGPCAGGGQGDARPP